MLEKERCDYLRKLRVLIAEAYHIEGFQYEPCTNGMPCRGNCPACDAEITKLSQLLSEKGCKLDPNKIPHIEPTFEPELNPKNAGYRPTYDDRATEAFWENKSKINNPNIKKIRPRLSLTFNKGGIGREETDEFLREQAELAKFKKKSEMLCKVLNIGKVLGISRSRLYTDGPGITTLVGMHGCQLNCEYCINGHATEYAEYTVEELYEDVKIDSLYFDATGGGICFGGHEPLLQQRFIKEFIKYVRKKGHTWKIGMETNLNEKIDIKLLKMLDFIIVDIKSINRDMYIKYTNDNNDIVLNNLKIIKDVVPDIEIRIPYIFRYNDEKDIKHSIVYLLNMGYKKEQLDVFHYTQFVNNSYGIHKKYKKRGNKS